MVNWEKCGKVRASSILRQYFGYYLTGLRQTRKITVQTCGFGAGNRMWVLQVRGRNANHFAVCGERTLSLYNLLPSQLYWTLIG